MAGRKVNGIRNLIETVYAYDIENSIKETTYRNRLARNKIIPVKGDEKLVNNLCKIYTSNRELFKGNTIRQRSRALIEFCEDNLHAFDSKYIEGVWVSYNSEVKMFSCIQAIGKVILANPEELNGGELWNTAT